jgi:multidrug resistance efflux pump
MNVAINRLDPSIPDPVESRRRAAGRLVRVVYATAVFGILAFFVVYFGAPLVFLSGPGTVSSQRQVVSLPYTVQIRDIRVAPGVAVLAGEQIAQVRSPEQDNIVATYMRALADVASRKADLRIKARVAQESLEATRAYRDVTENVAGDVMNSHAVTLSFRVEMLRERSLAGKAVVSQEAEVAESITQLADLEQLRQQLRERLDEIEQNFSGGRVVAPIPGVISTNLARAGQSLVAGSAIAEILDPDDIFVQWYIPNARLIEPKVGDEVFVVFGNRRIPGTIAEILPLSEVYTANQTSLTHDRPSTQIARIRFDPGTEPPALNSTVYVHMFYADVTAHVAGALVSAFGVD